MSTSTVRKQLRIPARRQLAVDTGTIGVIRVPLLAEPSVSLRPVAPPTSVRRLLTRVLAGIREASSVRRLSAADQLRNDAVYRNDEGGLDDDGGRD